jgi:hypothetical protein
MFKFRGKFLATALSMKKIQVFNMFQSFHKYLGSVDQA